MKVGDLVMHTIYPERLGIILSMVKPSGHRDYRCDILWKNGKVNGCHATLLRVINEGIWHHPRMLNESR